MNSKLILFDMGGTLIHYPSPEEVFYDALAYVRDGLSGSISRFLTDDLLNELFVVMRELRAEGMETLKEVTFQKALGVALLRTRDSLPSHLRFRLTEDSNCFLKASREELIQGIFNEFFSRRSYLIRGARQLLEYLKSKGIPMGIISNTVFPGYMHEEDLVRFDIRRYFSYLSWSSDGGIRKPNPELFHKALRHFNVHPDDVIYIGDSFPRDIVGANGVGISAMWISKKTKLPGIFEGWRVDDLFSAKRRFETLI